MIFLKFVLKFILILNIILVVVIFCSSLQCFENKIEELKEYKTICFYINLTKMKVISLLEFICAANIID